MSRKQKLNREQWLKKALEIISRKGFGRLNIDRLVRAMGVTKGSFYWHFQNREDFILQLIEYWDWIFTESVISHIDNCDAVSCDRLLELMRFVSKKQLARYDFAINAIAKNEPEAFPLVQEVMQKRIAYVAALLADMGLQGKELELRSRVIVMFMTQEQNSLLRESREEQLKRIPLAHKFFTQAG